MPISLHFQTHIRSHYSTLNRAKNKKNARKTHFFPKKCQFLCILLFALFYAILPKKHEKRAFFLCFSKKMLIFVQKQYQCVPHYVWTHRWPVLRTTAMCQPTLRVLCIGCTVGTCTTCTTTWANTLNTHYVWFVCYCHCKRATHYAGTSANVAWQ